MKPGRLRRHPEGGRFREAYRSATLVRRRDGRKRRALTHIYFSLKPGEVSCFHRVRSDEIWNLYQGRGLLLYLWDGAAGTVRRVTLSARSRRFCHVVPAGTWQAAAPLRGTVLAGCSVAPGFEFEDFEILSPDSEAARRLTARHPRLARFLHI